MLTITSLSRHFGGVYALRRVSLHIRAGELRGIIGPNGAGKSTLLHLISGHLLPDEGTIAVRDEHVEQLMPHERAGRGISIVFQGARIFRGMTVLENVMVGAHCRTRHGFLEAVLAAPGQVREERLIRDIARESLERVGLGALADRPAESLPIGQQRSMQVARALAAAPAVLLLDEPASGLRGAERREFAALLGRLRGEGLTMLLIEHDVALVTSVADRVTVLVLGEVIAEGAPAAVCRDEAVIAAYLGASPAP